MSKPAPTTWVTHKEARALYMGDCSVKLLARLMAIAPEGEGKVWVPKGGTYLWDAARIDAWFRGAMVKWRASRSAERNTSSGGETPTAGSADAASTSSRRRRHSYARSKIPLPPDDAGSLATLARVLTSKTQ